MKTIAPLAFALAMACTATLAFAQPPGAAAQPGSTGQPGARHAKVDANGDGAIDRTEASAHPKLAEHFDRLDKDKNGRIDAGERPQREGKGRAAGDRPGGKGQRGEAMAKLDANNDGRFSRDELAGRERALQNFAAIDANKDGFLTREEMRAHHQANRGEQGRPMR